jgi:hypothetical protein
MTQARDWYRLYWWSFGVRFLVGLAGWLLTLYTDVPFLQDAQYYEERASEVAQNWQAGESSPWLASAVTEGHKPWLIVLLLAGCYFLAGGARVTPLALLIYCLLTSWAPVLTYRIGLRLGVPRKGASLAGWLVALSPAFAFWAGALYKEGLILVVLNLAVYHLLGLQERWRPWSLLVLLACIPVMFALRFYLAILLGLVFVLGLLLGRSRHERGGADVVVGQVALAACFVVALVAVGFTDRARQLLPADLEEGLGSMERSRRDLSGAPSGYLQDHSVSTPEEAVTFFPLGFTYFLTVPWPWQIGSLRQNLAIPETALWIMLYPLVLLGMREGLRRNFQGTLLILVTTLAIAGFYALWIANIGTAYRLRVQVWVLWAVFAGWGWSVLRGWDRAGDEPAASAAGLRRGTCTRQLTRPVRAEGR